MPTTISPQEFVEKWRHVTASESKMAQSHFIDLCHLVGHPTPLEIDPAGSWFTFEAGASKTEGGQGWADVWKRGYFGWEYKGKHADLVKAYVQLCQYRETLENPPLLIVSDVDRIEIHTNFTNTPKRVVTLTLDDLLTPQGLDQLRDVFNNPEAFRSKQTTQNVTEDAAREFARLADLLRKYGEDAQRAAHFLIRILFCLFAEDIGLLPDKLFSRLVKSSLAHPESFPRRLEQLFAAMATGDAFGADDIKQFNGGLYNDSTALALDSDGMRILAGICDLDWSSIEPSILGTLFARSLDPSQRAKLGAQYTSKEDILLIVEPVVMAPLRRRWEEVKQQARDLAAKRGAAKGTQETKWHNALRDLIVGFASEIAKIQVLDPACGSGNFLYVALLLLLDLWKEVSVFGSELGLPMLLPDVNDSPSPLQMHGIETNSYAHDLAQTAVWIGYIQWRRDNGFGDPIEPILKPIETILQMDAILTHDEQGRPVEPEWPSADCAVGNPPFLGDKKMRAELGDKYVDDLRALYADRIPGQSDLVCYWFEKARAMIEAGKLKRAGLLATQGIRGGANREVLERIKRSGDIFMAWSDRPWILDGAAVRVSMIGFDNGEEKSRALDGASAITINADLTASHDLTTAQRPQENLGICFQGPVVVGPFDIEPDKAHQMLKQPNPHRRPNSEVVFPMMNGFDITHRERGWYIIDFGSRSLDEAALYESPFEYVKKHVKPLRDKNRDKQRRENWWKHGRSGIEMKTALKGRTRFIGTPLVSKYRVFVWHDAHTIVNQTVNVIARDDDYFFGVLHSHVHELWALRMGTALTDRPRYTPTTTFETFPFPWAPGKEPKNDPRVKAITQAARELVELRDNWLNPPDMSESELKKRTLTNLYNARPSWLETAHRKLDEAVLDAYGWPHDLSDDEILARLLELHLARAEIRQSLKKPREVKRANRTTN